MGILIGTLSSGSLHDFEGQCIKTKFVIIGVPLFPVQTYYKITDNMGIPIPMNGKSVLHGYLRTTFLGLGFVGMIAASAMPKAAVVLSFLLIGLGIYSWVLFAGGVKDKESRTRTILGKGFNYNMLPEHLPQEVQIALFHEAEQKWKKLNGENSSWIAAIAHGITPENKYLLYTLAYYANVMAGSEATVEMLAKLDTHFNPTTHANTEFATA
ncbi:hypothetical protein ACWKWU_11580 [Chitinophaga lutea]